MSTRSFITICVVALVLFVIALVPMALACAESDTYEVDVVVINFNVTPWGDIEVEVFDEEGNLYGYFVTAHEDVRVGDVVALTVFVYGDEENNEIVDAIRVDHLNTIEMIQWIRR